MRLAAIGFRWITPHSFRSNVIYIGTTEFFQSTFNITRNNLKADGAVGGFIDASALSVVNYHLVFM